MYIFSENDSTDSSNFVPDKIFEFDSLKKAWDFSLIIVSTFFLLFMNAIKKLNLQTYVQLFTDGH